LPAAWESRWLESLFGEPSVVRGAALFRGEWHGQQPGLCAAANGGGPSRLQAVLPAAAVAGLGLLGVDV